MNAPTPSTSAPSDVLADDALAGTEASPYYVRITNHGKIRNFVKFGREFLEKHPNRPIALHTRSMNPDKSSTVSTDAPIDEPSKKKRKLDQSTTLIPRLVSVAEIIKREFLIDATFREEKLRRSGQKELSTTRLHQYNRVGVAENTDAAPPPLELTDLLNGKNNLQIKRTPYMEIFLCTSELPSTIVGEATYQPPLEPPKKTKAAKARERKRLRRLNPDASSLNTKTVDREVVEGQSGVSMEIEERITSPT